MIDLSKSYEVFQPDKVTTPVHVIGLGAIGSNVVEQLVRIGLNKQLVLYDFDTVEMHNIANQNFIAKDVTRSKIDAVVRMGKEINPDFAPTIKPKGWSEDTPITKGYVFLCVDSIELRKKITESVAYAIDIKGILDFRMGLHNAQHYAATRTSGMKPLLNSMEFTDKEANEATPRSACGTTLSVVTTVKIITAYGVTNFINMVTEKPWSKLIIIDAFEPGILAI